MTTLRNIFREHIGEYINGTNYGTYSIFGRSILRTQCRTCRGTHGELIVEDNEEMIGNTVRKTLGTSWIGLYPPTI